MPKLVVAHTTLVGHRTPSEIVLAADSKVSWRQDRKTVNRKTFQVGELFVSQAGLLFHTSTGFEANEVAVDSIQEGITLLNSLPVYEREMKKDLTLALLSLRRENRNQYERLVEQSPSGTFFGTIESGLPILASIIFRLDPENQVFDHDVLTHLELLACTRIIDEGNQGLAIGQVNQIAIYTSAHEGFWHSDPLASAFMLIELEIHADPGNVDWPIHAVQIRPDGCRWFEKGTADARLLEFYPPRWEL